MKRDSQALKMSPQDVRRKIFSILKLVIASVVLIFIFLCILGALLSYTSPDRYATGRDVEPQFNTAESIGGSYYGDMIETIYSGTGVFLHIDGGVYSGEFDDSKRNGTGVYTWTNGDQYSGTWSGDQMDSGTYTFASGAVYTGTFRDNYYFDGVLSLTEAETVKDSLNAEEFTVSYSEGSVEEIHLISSGGLVYDGAIDGQAEIRYPSGNSYTGDVRGGKRYGSGTFRWLSDGTVSAAYDGGWKDDLMDGIGTYYYSGDTGSWPNMEGEFSSGSPIGQGIYYKGRGNSFRITWENGLCQKVEEI